MKMMSHISRAAPILLALGMIGLPAGAQAQQRAQGPAVVPVQDIQKDGSAQDGRPGSGNGSGRGPVLNIPGLPPIQMPPGAQVFGPDGPRSLPGAPARPAPFPPRRAQGLDPQDGDGAAGADDGAKPGEGANTADGEKDKKRKIQTRADAMNELFERLAKSTTEREARGITRAIERLWAQSGSATADLLMGRALGSFRKKNYKLALQLLDKIVIVKPQWAEGWNQRATARYYNADPMGSVADIARALSHEPRHFNALVGLGLILQRAEEDKRALQVFRKALELNPHNKKVKELVERLELKVEGRKI